MITLTELLIKNFIKRGLGQFVHINWIISDHIKWLQLYNISMKVDWMNHWCDKEVKEDVNLILN